MMQTPICDFVAAYLAQKNCRFHMPGHKGAAYLGCEGLDITEIPGADSLYEADGIIAQSEQNASRLFGCRTFYSAEGSSHAIRAMLALTCTTARAQGKTPVIWAGRNAHSTFLSAAALLDFAVQWLYGTESSYLSCTIDPGALEAQLRAAKTMPTAVYVTSPDYLGNQADIKGLAAVCHRYGALLLVDNAHGAYLRFLSPSSHPAGLGADLCCDSAHKTLPVLTGGAYLHLGSQMAAVSDREVRQALRLFGSTSPSYLILQSLDLANRYLAEDYPAQLGAFLPQISALKARLTAHGYRLSGAEPLKLTIAAKDYGYTGAQMAAILAGQKIIAEFSDPDYIVFMLTPSLAAGDLAQLATALLSLPRKAPICEPVPQFSAPKKVMEIRRAMLSPSETLPASRCLGKTLARASVGCPPAVPILVCGERIDESAVKCFQYYGIETCDVVKET